MGVECRAAENAGARERRSLEVADQREEMMLMGEKKTERGK